MSYSIPSDEQVTSALRRVMNKARIVQSQRVLHELVLDELQQKNKSFRVTPKRLRLLALNQGFVDVEIHSREGDPKKTLHRCPVCHHQLKRVRNLTIWGGVVTIELRCPHCGYWTGKKKRIPTRYVFHYVKKKKS
ncbi:MAG: hypothetical protein KGY65_05410 [Candidatus Thermoplasmatota archaeon]|jgi:hypothetical protein|nr:hypothetical protein [Candidatus Thermoplasmatota archaeon]MBS3802169.1 hypothetical protein [Candidatus Thermoplasmatota archaeon]